MGFRRVKKVRIGERGWRVGVYTFDGDASRGKRTFDVFVTVNGRVFTQKVYSALPGETGVNRPGGWPWREVQCLNSWGEPPGASLHLSGCGGTTAITQWASDQLMKVVPIPD